MINIGDGNGDLTKVLFAKIKQNSLVYEEGKDDNFVFSGKPYKEWNGSAQSKLYIRVHAVYLLHALFVD